MYVRMIRFTPKLIKAIENASKEIGPNGVPLTVHQIAERFGTSPAQISSILRTGKPRSKRKTYSSNTPPRYSESFKRMLVQKFYDGATTADLSRVYEVSEGSIARWARVY